MRGGEATDLITGGAGLFIFIVTWAFVIDCAVAFLSDVDVDDLGAADISFFTTDGGIGDLSLNEDDDDCESFSTTALVTGGGDGEGLFVTAVVTA